MDEEAKYNLKWVVGILIFIAATLITASCRDSYYEYETNRKLDKLIELQTPAGPTTAEANPQSAKSAP